MSESINSPDITELEKVKLDFNKQIDFNLMGIEEGSDSNEKIPHELEKMVSELEDKPKPNLDETITIIIGTIKNPQELKIGHQLSQGQKVELS